jgi:glycosyltransferase involved in cell wall biosynthesis
MTRFTFCIPNLNKIEFLAECIQSVLDQDCEDWVCVFVDGFSTDGCWEYMQRFAEDERFRLLRGLKQGMYADWNYCLEQVKSEYFYFLPSDDTCFPGLVSKTVAALDQHLDIAACHFQYSFIDGAGKTTHEPDDVMRLNSPLYLEANQSAHVRSGFCEFMLHFAYRSVYRTMTSLVMRRSVIDRLGEFSQDYGSIGDLDWAMRLCLMTDVLFIPEWLATWRLYEGQATQLNQAVEQSGRILAVATKNLDAMAKVPMYSGRLTDDDRWYILSQVEGAYYSTLTRSIVKGDVQDLIQRGLNSGYISYLLKKLVYMISFRSLFGYYSNDEFADRLIRRYQLEWPPKILSGQPQSCSAV